MLCWYTWMVFVVFHSLVPKGYYWLSSTLLLLCNSHTAFGINCYQCASDQEPYSLDRCGASKSFQPEEHVLVDCGTEEATSPGTMCLKYIQISPRAFIWDKKWKSIIRRCAQVSSHGQLQGCDWGYDCKPLHASEEKWFLINGSACSPRNLLGTVLLHIECL